MTSFAIIFTFVSLFNVAFTIDVPNCDVYRFPDENSQFYIYNCWFHSLDSFDFSLIDGNKALGLVFTCTDEMLSVLETEKFFHLNQLQELRINNCNLVRIELGALRGLLALRTLIITPRTVNRTQITIDGGLFDPTPSLNQIEIGMGIYGMPNRLLCKLRDEINFINWAGNNLKNLDEIGCGENNSCCNRLNVLGIAHNRLKKLEARNLGFPNLEILEVGHNDVGEIQNGALRNLENLKYLGLRDNELTTIDENLLAKSQLLLEIDLSVNKLTYLPPNLFRHTKSVQFLHLSENQISFNETSKDLFFGLGDLLHLNLSFNQIEYLPEAIFNHLTSIANLSLSNNLLSQISDNDFRYLSSLQFLNLSNNNVTDVSINALTALININELDLSNNQLTTLPNITFLAKLAIFQAHSNNITEIDGSAFLGVNELVGLKLSDNCLKVLKNTTFMHVRKLIVINLGSNEISDIEEGIFDGFDNLQFLILSNNKIKKMGMLFAEVKVALNLSHNEIEVFDFTSTNSTLATIDLRQNKLHTIYSSEEVVKYNLKKFYASDNKLQIFNVVLFPLNIERIDLSRNNISHLQRFSNVIFPKLYYVDLSYNSISEISYTDIHYQFPGIPIGQPITEMNLNANPMLCSCTNDWLLESMRDNNRQFPKIVELRYCIPTYSRFRKFFPLVYIPEIELKNMLCEDFDECPTQCQCFKDTIQNVYIADCFNVNWNTELPTIPERTTALFLDSNSNIELAIEGCKNMSKLNTLYLNNSQLATVSKEMLKGFVSLRELHLEDNWLIVINGNEFDLISGIEKLFLHQNKLEFLSPKAFWKLKELRLLTLHGNMLVQPQVWAIAPSLVQITLGNNSFKCDCDYVIKFQKWVNSKSDVMDFPDISNAYCQNEPSSPLMQYNDTSCFEVTKKENLIAIIVPTVAVFLLGSIFFILLFLYRTEMKVWLYSRYGVRLFYNNKNVEDGKLFDAFISYANEDDEWVAEELVPQLKEYKLCLHQLHFPVGEFIADSIVQAVENSSRTVIILTPNYVNSRWCRFEFDTAHVQSLIDRCKRLVVVILEDVENKEMDKNLRAYVKTNTFLDRKDKFFWEKLKYALPDVEMNKVQSESSV